MKQFLNKRFLIALGWMLSLVISFFIGYFHSYSFTKEKVLEGADTTVSADPLQEILNSSKVMCGYEGGNVGWTECMIETLDRISAEREWKQRKLESIKDPQINIYNMVTVLADDQLKIRKWREHFEQGRDLWCEAQLSFYGGSGTPGNIAQCKIALELLAIRDLDYLYYGVITSEVLSSRGITDFEPKKADIDKLVLSNRTVRGCVWAGEEQCD